MLLRGEAVSQTWDLSFFFFFFCASHVCVSTTNPIARINVGNVTFFINMNEAACVFFFSPCRLIWSECRLRSHQVTQAWMGLSSPSSLWKKINAVRAICKMLLARNGKKKIKKNKNYTWWLWASWFASDVEVSEHELLVDRSCWKGLWVELCF